MAVKSARFLRRFAATFVAVSATLLFASFSGGVAFAATKLTVYTAVEPKLLARYAKDFSAQNPGITI